MKKGSVGILSKEIFDPKSKHYINEKFVFLTTAQDITNQHENLFKIDVQVFEANWYPLDINTEFVCSAIYLSESAIPDKILSPGQDFKMSIQNRDYEYFKVILFLNDTSQVVYIHEKSMNLFIWTDA